MTEKEKQILELFDKLLPLLSDLDKEKLLAFGEGLGFAANANRPPLPGVHIPRRFGGKEGE